MFFIMDLKRCEYNYNVKIPDDSTRKLIVDNVKV